MYLMCKDIPVLNFDITQGTYQIMNDSLLPVRLRNAYQFSENPVADIIHNHDITVDYLASRILGLTRKVDNSSGSILHCHPLYDHNKAFDTVLMKDAAQRRSDFFSDCSMKEAALYAAKNCNIHAVKPITKDLFLSKKMYKSFMKRAAELKII